MLNKNKFYLFLCSTFTNFAENITNKTILSDEKDFDYSIRCNLDTIVNGARMAS